MHNNLLQKLGLSQDESEIYLFLLQNPQKNISQISLATKINRPKLYKIIPNLEQNGLITKTLLGKRSVFVAQNPEILKNYLENIKNDFDVFIPEMQKLFQNNFSKPIFKQYQWFEWVKNIFIDIGQSCQPWETFYRYSSRHDVQNTSISEKDYQRYKSLRDKKQLQRYVITNEYLESLKPEKLDKDVVVIPKKYDIFEDNITKIIYANKVVIIDYNSRESFVIESEIFAWFEKKIFLLLFKFLKK